MIRNKNMRCALIKNIGSHGMHELAEFKLRITRIDVEDMMKSDEN